MVEDSNTPEEDTLGVSGVTYEDFPVPKSDLFRAVEQDVIPAITNPEFDINWSSFSDLHFRQGDRVVAM